MSKSKFLIITTVPQTLFFFKGQIQELKKAFDMQLISSPGKLFSEICNSEGVEGYSIIIKREISIISDLRSLFRLINLFLRIKPFVIHGNTPKASLLSMLAGWISRVPIRIYYIHGLRYQGTLGFKRRLLISMEKLSCLFSTNIYTVSYGVKDTLWKDSITKKNVKIIREGSINGIDLSYFSPRNIDINDIYEKYNFNKDNFIYGFVGRLVKDKGIQELVHSFLKVNKDIPKTRLLLVGDFEDDSINSELKNKIFFNKNIIYTGFQKDIRPFLKIMDTFVFPSYREGFGVSLIEASAMGVPIISSNIIGCNEIIVHKKNGILIPPKDETALLQAMKKLLLDAALRNALAKNARPMITARYEQKMVWEAILAEYKRLEQEIKFTN